MDAYMYEIWGCVLLLSLIFEAVTVQLVSIWFVPPALLCIGLQALGISPVLQCIVFALLSLLLIVFARPILSRLLYRKPYEPTNTDRLIGCKGRVTETVCNEKEQGTVKIMGELWMARSADGSPIEAGSEVVIRSITGVKLICENAQQQT